MLINFDLLNKHNEIAHFCSTRMGGASVGNYASFNLSPFTGDVSANQHANLLALTTQINCEPDKLVFPFQNHGTDIRIIENSYFTKSAAEKSSYLNGVDALITAEKGICIGITTADCVPLLFYDTKKKVVAAAHAGWRGTCHKIAERTLSAMNKQFDCNAKDIVACIGPSISVDVYNVGIEVYTAFESAGFPTNEIFTKKDDQLFLDLWTANKWLINKVGIPMAQIEVANICTYTNHDKFFSARRLGIKSGRMLSGIMIR